MFLLCLCVVLVSLALGETPQTAPLLVWEINGESGVYTVSLDQSKWLSSPENGSFLCVAGKPVISTAVR